MRGVKQLGTWVVLISLASLPGFSAGRLTPAGALGVITGKDPVRVNNQRVLPGTTVFAGDVIQTGAGSSAIVKLLTGTLATVSADSEVALSPDPAHVSLNLRQGAILVESPASQPGRVSVGGASVYVYGEGNLPALCRIAAVGKSAAVFNDRGHVEIHGSGAPQFLPPGKYVRLEAGKPQGGSQLAGKVNAAIPAETLQRGGAPEVALKLQDNINWEDVVKTLKMGRVRIELLDGSFLNIGARSEMRIVKHDPQTQQTEVQMTVGRLRGEVVKLTKPGASFQVRTQTAVIGVVGTIFLITATPKSTRVTCIEGLVKVTNILPAVAGATTLSAGQAATIPRGLPPTSAFQVPGGQLQAQMGETNVAGPGVVGPVGPAAPGGPGAVPAPTAVTNIATTATTTAAGATSAGVSGVAMVRADTAKDTLTQATTTLNTAQADSTTAITAATQATVAAQSTTTAAIDLAQQVLSPSQPCGCF